MIALLADPLVWVLLGLVTAPRALIRALTSKHATPLDVLLGRIPWPGSRTPRKDHPCIPAASTASTNPVSSTKRRAATAATTTSPATRTASRTASVLDALTAPLRLRHAAGQHTAPLSLTWDKHQGRYRHTETGPMQIPDEYLAALRHGERMMARVP